jgi:oligoendopeptidase F
VIDLPRRTFVLSAAALAAFARGDVAFAFADAPPDAAAAWDLRDLYPSDAAWEAERKAIAAAIPGLAGYKGTLGQSAGALKAALSAASDLYRRTSRLYSYAGLKADEDLRVSANQERRQQAQDVFTALGAALAWMSPEILKVGEPRIRALIAADPAGLGKFRFQLEDTLRQAPHTLTPEGEALLAESGSALAGPGDIRVQLVASDIPRPTSTTRAIRSTARRRTAPTASSSSTVSGKATTVSRIRSVPRSPAR